MGKNKNAISAEEAPSSDPKHLTLDMEGEKCKQPWSFCQLHFLAAKDLLLLALVLHRLLTAFIKTVLGNRKQDADLQKWNPQCHNRYWARSQTAWAVASRTACTQGSASKACLRVLFNPCPGPSGSQCLHPPPWVPPPQGGSPGQWLSLLTPFLPNSSSPQEKGLRWTSPDITA